jgi:hypothetical protein
MVNPDLLPHRKTMTFFSEQAGRSSSSFGLPPTEASFSSPPPKVDIALLIHLYHYVDWMPQMVSSFTPRVSGLSFPSSGSTPGRPYPFFKGFDWTDGVEDGQVVAWPLRLLDLCCRLLGGVRRDEDPDDGRHDQSRYNWRCNISTRGCPVDDLSCRVKDRRRQPEGGE